MKDMKHRLALLKGKIDEVYEVLDRVGKVVSALLDEVEKLEAEAEKELEADSGEPLGESPEHTEPIDEIPGEDTLHSSRPEHINEEPPAEVIIRKRKSKV